MNDCSFTIDVKPVSVNACYSTNRQRRRFMTDAGKSFKYMLGFEAMRHRPTDWNRDKYYFLSIHYFFKTLRSDIDGSNKLVQDAFQDIFYDNDTQVKKLLCYSSKDAKNPRIEIKIEYITWPFLTQLQ